MAVDDDEPSMMFDRLTRDADTCAQLVEELVRVWRDARRAHLQFLTDPHTEVEDSAYLIGEVLPTNEVWTARVGGEVAGFIAFSAGWVNHLYVAAAFQGRGVGGGLLTIAQRGGSPLELWAFECNEPAIRFYERRGFRVIERTDGSQNEARQPDVRMRSDGRPR